jgi:hypothetical protein
MKTDCNFVTLGDIATFKRYFHTFLHVECIARDFHRRNKLSISQNAILWRCWLKLAVLNFLFYILRSLHVVFSLFYTPNVVLIIVVVYTNSVPRKMLSFDENEPLFRFCLSYLTFNRCFHCILHAEYYSARLCHLWSRPSSSLIAIFYGFCHWYAVSRYNKLPRLLVRDDTIWNLNL